MWFLKADNVENWCYANAFTKEECEKIIEYGNTLELKNGEISYNLSPDNSMTETVRKGKIAFIPVNEDTKWIFQRLTDFVVHINDKYFNYDLIAINEIQFTVYEPGDFYQKHVDTQYNVNPIRKLSANIQLSDQSSMYEGGDLLLHCSNTPAIAKKEQGIMTAFNSLALHELTPITKGTRYGLDLWVTGPKFK